MRKQSSPARIFVSWAESRSRFERDLIELKSARSLHDLIKVSDTKQKAVSYEAANFSHLEDDGAKRIKSIIASTTKTTNFEPCFWVKSMQVPPRKKPPFCMEQNSGLGWAHEMRLMLGAIVAHLQ